MSNLREYRDLFLPGSIVFAALVIGGSLVYTAGVGNGSGTLDRTTATVTRDTASPSLVRNNGSTVDFEIRDSDHLRGNPQATITVVEFSDFQCPFCSRFHPTMLQALKEYKDQVRWVYKHFPLDAIHPEARPAAEASECVWEQKGDEGFWAFADIMFEQQERLGSSFYREVADSLGVNLAEFDTCVLTRKYQDKVEQDYQQGLQAGVTGTPGSFVNGIPVRGAIPYSQLQSIINSQL